MVEISLLNKNCIRLKGKKVTFVVDPTSDTPKTTADAVIVFNNPKSDDSRVTDSRIIIESPGEYEVSGSKISAVTTPKGIIYKVFIDGVAIILGKEVDFSKLESNFTTCDVFVLSVDEEFSESLVTALGPKITVLYGDKKNEGAKILGFENISSVSKIQIVKDKLPEKMEVVILE